MPKQHRKPHSHSASIQRGKNAGQLRIIGGQWRGRKLSIIDADGLRPTSNRIRETLFNWLAPTINHSTCLDLFAGSGALAFEALSLGAAKAIMIEKNALAADQLKKNGEQLHTNNANIIQQDALRWLQQPTAELHSINIVFIDPPFAHGLWEQAIERLHTSKLLAPQALIYIEGPKGQAHNVPLQWKLRKEKTAGEVNYRLYEYEMT